MIVDLNRAIETVKKGGIVIYPTDTAFGIGCRIDNAGSVKKLFNLRKRDPSKAVPVLFDSIDRVSEYVLPIEKDIEELMKKYWPGALTIVLKSDYSKVSPFVRGGGKTLGVRIPDNNIVLGLIEGVGVPIVGTSANFAGDKTPFRFEDLDAELVALVDGVLIGETKEGNSSTVIDCSEKPWKILRQGAISISL